MNLKETIKIMKKEGLVIERVLYINKGLEVQFKKEVESNGNRRKGSG
ncbi:MAG: hypothetical protein IH948_03780 [Bacteroidetes bacterium]|nr:hypothetical protein [Bacteroidota bacterium]